MKPTFACFLLLSLLILVADLSYGRKEQGEYWKKVMKDEPIPEVIKGLLFENSDAVENKRFMNNFDPNPNAIIYHSHGTHKMGMPSVKGSAHHHH